MTVQLLRNPFYDRIRVLQDLIVPEAYHSVSKSLQERRALAVCLKLLSMLAAINLDDDLEC